MDDENAVQSWREDTVRLTDPRAMRALAHPVRMHLLGALRRHGPAKVGGLAEIVDEAPASVSYHLSTLAKYGFVEEAPELARDRRETWWRATARTTTYEPVELLKDPASWAAGTVLRQQIYRDYHAALMDGLAAEPQLDPAWVAAATSSDNILHIDVAELAELGEELNALFDRWMARSRPDDPDAAAVTLMAHAFRRHP